MLKTATPYMLRKDGKLIDCSPIHPYLMDVRMDEGRELDKLFSKHIDYLDWFAVNGIDVADDIKSLKSMYGLYRGDRRFDRKIIDSYIKINDITNNQFCRVRTSDIRFGGDNHSIYFRVSSSNGFDWFPLIWNVVYENRNWISDVTIVRDPQAKNCNTNDFYRLGGEITNHLDVVDFPNLKGHPLVESGVSKLT